LCRNIQCLVYTVHGCTYKLCTKCCLQ
jgi:hypothetical protein